ncbi:protein TolR [Aquirhabdus sp.]|uniref:protein TolR n=1 Tax=Aquirhabdus sp. TaxID=2824160 RepID=UPI00396C398D
MALSGSPFARVKKPLKSDMNVVPYIDVMLVLLVIFMVTAPMITAGLTVDLPKAVSDPLSVSKDRPAIVTVEADGKLSVRFGEEKDRTVTQSELSDQLAQAQLKNPNLAVLVQGDRKVPYGDVVTLMATLQASGLPQVGLMTEQLPPSKP